MTKLEVGGGIGPPTSPGHVFCSFFLLPVILMFYHPSRRFPSREPACIWEETEAHICGEQRQHKLDKVHRGVYPRGHRNELKAGTKTRYSQSPYRATSAG